MKKLDYFSLLIFILLFKISLSQSFISQTIYYDGNNREYELYIPENYNDSNAVPLLFNFHGGNGTISDQIYLSDMRSLADENNFIIVYPQAIADPTDDGSLNWIFKGDSDHDDVYFIESIIDELSSQYSIDLTRVYACGYSLGGEFVYELLCRLNNKIAAGVVVARTMGQYQYENCNPEHPTAIMTILGTEDYESNYDGVVYNGVTYYISADDTHQYWTDYNNADINPSETELPNNNSSDGSTVTKRIWGNGEACVSVVELRINGGGHDWPGSTGNMDINSNNEIWDFVSQYSLDGLIEECSLSVNIYNKSEFKIYPNPVENYIQIINQSENRNFIISDLKAGVIFKSTIINGENIFDISELSPAIYNLKIGQMIFKILKK